MLSAGGSRIFLRYEAEALREWRSSERSTGGGDSYLLDVRWESMLCEVGWETRPVARVDDPEAAHRR